MNSPYVNTDYPQLQGESAGAANTSDSASRLDELRAQQAELQAMIEAEEKKERDADLKIVKDLVKKHGFTATMLKSVLAKGRNRA